MERLPIAKQERKLVPIAEDLAWYINRLSVDKLRGDGYLTVLSQGKKAIADGRIPDWEFVELLKEVRQVVVSEDGEEERCLDRLEAHAATLRAVRRVHLDDKTEAMAGMKPKRSKEIPPMTTDEEISA